MSKMQKTVSPETRFKHYYIFIISRLCVCLLMLQFWNQQEVISASFSNFLRSYYDLDANNNIFMLMGFFLGYTVKFCYEHRRHRGSGIFCENISDNIIDSNGCVRSIYVTYRIKNKKTSSIAQIT